MNLLFERNATMKKVIVLVGAIFALAVVGGASVSAGEPSPTYASRNVDFSAGDGNSFSIKRKKQYLNGGVVITATVPASEFGGEADYSVSFRMGMSGI